MLSLEDIKVGMKVNPDELSNIFNTLIILTHFNNNIGEIVYIGEPNTEESNYLYNTLTEICTVFNNDLEVAWDE